MPAKDVADYIVVAIESVMAQTYETWELIIVENGSTDRTPEIIAGFKDNKIRVVRSEKTGLSHARNLGLNLALGEFICFLDADDKFPKRSLEARIEFFVNHPEITFLDGIVHTYNESLSKIKRVWIPDFRGTPKMEMSMLSPKCFCGITWMIRRSSGIKLIFDETWTHLEDRMFFLSIAHLGLYDCVQEPIYIIRRRAGSLMANHAALESAYRRFIIHVNSNNLLTEQQKRSESRYFHRMFFKTYLKHFKWRRAVKHLKYL